MTIDKLNISQIAEAFLELSEKDQANLLRQLEWCVREKKNHVYNLHRKLAQMRGTASP